MSNKDNDDNMLFGRDSRITMLWPFSRLLVFEKPAPGAPLGERRCRVFFFCKKKAQEKYSISCTGNRVYYSYHKAAIKPM